MLSCAVSVSRDLSELGVAAVIALILLLSAKEVLSVLPSSITSTRSTYLRVRRTTEPMDTSSLKAGRMAVMVVRLAPPIAGHKIYHCLIGP